MSKPDSNSESDREWLVNQIAHALRNPIFAASVQTEALHLRARDPQAVRETADKLHAQLRRLSGAIDEMLLFGRPYQAHHEDIVVAELLNNLTERYVTGHRRAPAQVRLAGKTAGLVGHWDRTAITVILERILDNAVEHTDEPHEIDLAAEADGERHIVFTVRDRGEGIPAEILDQVLLPFFPQHSGRPGLGLAIADKFVRELNGRIEIESTEGDGTTVRCVLPVNSEA